LDPISYVLFSRCIGKYFPLYWLEPITRRIGWNQFPVVLLFPLYWLEPISRRIDWNQCPAVLVGTVSRKIFFSVFVGTNFPPYWLEPIPCRFVFPAVFVGTNFPPYLLEPSSPCIFWNQFYATVFVVTMILTKQYMPAAPSLCLGDIEYTVIFSYENKLLNKLFSQFY
jgi:hypothetical protein